MSEDDLWLIVEGRDHDRPHYEKLLKALPSTKDRSVSIRLAEQIELDGVSAGGKDHALTLHDHLESGGKLSSENKSGESMIMFMLDRDRDDFLGTMRLSDHILYTFGSDVEADILLHADIWAALRDAYGVDSQLSDRVKRAVADPAAQLLALWNEWLTLSLVALGSDSPGCAPWGSPSKINTNVFEQSDASRAAEVADKIQTAAEQSAYEVACVKASSHVSSHGVRLLKGRWIARYIKYLVDTHLDGEIVRVNVQQNAVIDTALATLSHSSQWAKEYDKQFSKLLLSTYSPAPDVTSGA